MIGTLINFSSILIGGLLGLVLGSRLPERLRQTVMYGIGLFTFALGIQMFLKTNNPLIVLGSILTGGILGEWWRIEDRLQNLGQWLEQKLLRRESGSKSGFVRGFLVTSLLFCIGPMAILGSIQDGMTGDFSILTAKSVMDGFASIAFASNLGLGVAFSALPVLLYQGAISLLAGQMHAWVTPIMMAEMTATGGVIIVGLAISSLLELRPIRVGNFLPALFIAPILVLLLVWLGVTI
jgi:uncharacterized protein